MGLRGNYGIRADGRLLLGTYQHWAMQPSGWGYALAQEATEMLDRGSDYLRAICEQAAQTSVCETFPDRQTNCYWDHRPFVQIGPMTPGDDEGKGKTYEPSFGGLVAMWEVYPPHLGLGTDIEFSYWWEVDAGIFTVEFGPGGIYGRGQITPVSFPLGTQEVNDILAEGAWPFQGWVVDKYHAAHQ